MRSDQVQRPAAGYFRNGQPYNRFGRGPRPLVVFQGLMFENKPQTFLAHNPYPFLESDYTVYVVLRKPGMPAGYSMKDMADDYAQMIRAEFGGPVDVLGVSTGGSIVQHFAANHPDLVCRLVLHSSAHTLSQEAKQVQLEAARLAQQGRFAQAGALFADFLLPRSGFWKHAARPLVWLVTRLMTLGASKDLTDFVVTVEAEDQHHFQNQLAQISAPTLVIAGTHDPFYTEALFRETAAGIPNARLVLYEKKGHAVGGKQFEQDVRAFLREP